ncbi:unnamed protein product [Rotaria socialis]|uniref:TIR domain-containing protein n=1 Tax=Rotaria socialis TaxID=392032 RepID=A0A820K1I5_9BILA|nr:unnamed protein product [Rotaria socialis]CAF4335603.1 unnamed protein product [Rotaria socialis]
MPNPGRLLSTIIESIEKTFFGKPETTTSIEQLLEALQGLIQYDQIKDEILKQDNIPFILECTNKLMKRPLILTFEMLWSLAFSDDIGSVLRTNSNFLDKIQSIAKDNKDTSVKKVIDGLIWKLAQVMNAMADAVENSEFVLVCMSDSYKQSTYCQAEAEYAFGCKRRLVPLKVRPRYRAAGCYKLREYSILNNELNSMHTSKLCITAYSRFLTILGEIINVPSSAPNTSSSSSSTSSPSATLPSPPTATAITTATTIANHNPSKPLSGMPFVPAPNLVTSYDFSIVTNISALDTFKMADHYSSQLLILDLLRRRMMNTY